MIEVTKTLEFCSGHRLLDYDGPCARPHGHNYKLEVTVALGSDGGLDKTGFVVDFKDLKGAMKYATDRLDHRMVLRKDDPLVAHLEESEVVIWDHNPTAENMAGWFAEMIEDFFDSESIQVREIVLWETSTSYAKWTP